MAGHRASAGAAGALRVAAEGFAAGPAQVARLQRALATTGPPRIVGMQYQHPHPQLLLGASTAAGARRLLASRVSAKEAEELPVAISAARLEQLLEAEITTLSLVETRPLTLQSILDLASGTDHTELAKLLHGELPVRFAQRIKMLEELPGWNETTSFAGLRDMYIKSFKELRLADPGHSLKFQRQLRKIKQRHSHTNKLVEGFKNFADDHTLGDINTWLDNFFTLRVSTNMLISHYLHTASGELETMGSTSSRRTDLDFDPDFDPYVSSIDPQCMIGSIAVHAAHVVGKMCTLKYGIAPAIKVKDCGAKSFSFVPRYLFYILSELLKNSVRATVEAHPGVAEEELPAVTVMISGDEDFCCCRVSDEGGGIPVDNLHQVWSYFYTTAEPIETIRGGAVDAPLDIRWLLQKEAEAEENSQMSVSDPVVPFKEEADAVLMRSPLAGLGCGLPLSRLYAEYLGGRIELQTLPNYGADVFVYLSRLQNSESFTHPGRQRW